MGGILPRDALCARVEPDSRRRSPLVAQVFSAYASRRDASEPDPYSRGMNSIQLVFDGERWWIVSVMWDREDAEHPIPDSLLVMPAP